VQGERHRRVIGQAELPSLVQIRTCADQVGKALADMQVVVPVAVSRAADPAVRLLTWCYMIVGVGQPAFAQSFEQPNSNGRNPGCKGLWFLPMTL